MPSPQLGAACCPTTCTEPQAGVPPGHSVHPLAQLKAQEGPSNRHFHNREFLKWKNRKSDRKCLITLFINILLRFMTFL